jgi:hypothetical protein
MKVGKENCHALSAMIRTENGWVEIFLYSSEKDFNFWNPVFHKIGTDVELSTSVAYQPRWTDFLRSGKAVLDFRRNRPGNPG